MSHLNPYNLFRFHKKGKCAVQTNKKKRKTKPYLFPLEILQKALNTLEYPQMNIHSCIDIASHTHFICIDTMIFVYRFLLIEFIVCHRMEY